MDTSNHSPNKLFSSDDSDEMDFLLRTLSERLMFNREIANGWKIAANMYGKRVAKELKKTMPADPVILIDIVSLRHYGDGMTEKEIEELLNNYSEEDWGAELAYFQTIEKKAKKLYQEIMDEND